MKSLLFLLLTVIFLQSQLAQASDSKSIGTQSTSTKANTKANTKTTDTHSVKDTAERPRVDSKRARNTNGFVYGLGFTTNKEIYKGYNRRNLILPLIGYKGENLTVFGPFVSYKVASFFNIELALQLAPRFQSFDESDSYIFEGMAKREFSMDAGFGLTYKHNRWKIKFSSMADILQRSKGLELTSSISHRFNIGPIFIEPTASLSYLNKDHVDYYYGVKANETTIERGAYLGDSALNPSIGLSVATPIFFGGFTRLSIKQTFYDKAIAKSPLVEDKSSLAINMFFSKLF